MTPQERQLVTDLFDRLARLESAPRDADAERAIADGLKRAPNALYPLVQTVLLQDEALRRADARIRTLEGGGEPAGGGFLDSMRNALFPQSGGAATSVPSVRADSGGDPRWGATSPTAPAMTAPQGGSFLGTAAASAAGVIGGALLFQSIQSMFGGHRGQAFAAPVENERSPWGGGDAAGSDLARDAGLNDIGRGGETRSAGLFDAGDDVSDDDAGGDFDVGGADDAA